MDNLSRLDTLLVEVDKAPNINTLPWTDTSVGKSVGKHAASDKVVDQYIARSGVYVKHNASLANYYVSSDTVNVPFKNRFDIRDEYYIVLFHELVHSTGHPSRLGRMPQSVNGYFTSILDRSLEEMTAEMGAAFLAQELGLDVGAKTFAYINAWSRRHPVFNLIVPLTTDRRKQRLQQAGKDALVAVDYILNGGKD